MPLIPGLTADIPFKFYVRISPISIFSLEEAGQVAGIFAMLEHVAALPISRPPPVR